MCQLLSLKKNQINLRSIFTTIRLLSKSGCGLSLYHAWAIITLTYNAGHCFQVIVPLVTVPLFKLIQVHPATLAISSAHLASGRPDGQNRQIF